MILGEFICIKYNILLVFSVLPSLSLILPFWVLGFWYLHSLSNIITSFLPDNKLLAYVWAAWPPLLKHKLPTCQWGNFSPVQKWIDCSLPKGSFPNAFQDKAIVMFVSLFHHLGESPSCELSYKDVCLCENICTSQTHFLECSSFLLFKVFSFDMAGTPIFSSLDATSFHRCPQRARSCNTWFSLCRSSARKAAVQGSSWNACRLLCLGLQGGSAWPPQVLKVWYRSLLWVFWSNFCSFGVGTQSLYITDIAVPSVAAPGH